MILFESKYIYSFETHCNNKTMHSVYVLDCGLPSTTDGVIVSVSSTTFGSVATYTCALGYTDMTGSPIRTCNCEGEWTDSEPICSPIGSPCKKLVSQKPTYNLYQYICMFSLPLYYNRKICTLFLPQHLYGHCTS